MRFKPLLYGAVAGGILLMPPHLTSTWGLRAGHDALAKEVFTRKRVKGRWIKGKFAKADKGAKPAAKPEGAKPADRKRASRRDAARRRIATRQPESVQPDRAPDTPPVAVAEPPAPSPAPRAADARPRAVEPSAVLTTSSIGPAVLDDGGRERMRSAMEAKARAMAPDRPEGGATPDAPAPPGARPRSVTIDFDKGSRTVVYGDDRVVSEPFDVARAKVLLAPPENGAAGR